MKKEEVDQILHALCKSTSTVLTIKDSTDPEIMSVFALRDAIFMKVLYEEIAPDVKPPKKVMEIIKALKEVMNE